MIDTHCHFLHPDFDPDRQEVLQKVWNSGVRALLEVGYTPELARHALSWARRDSRVRVAAGLHPHEAGRVDDDDFAAIESIATEPEVVAIGETGLDFFRDWAPRDRQEELFRRTIRLARRLNKPLVLHVRDAYDEVFAVLEDEGGSPAGGVFHCFQGDASHAERATGMGFSLGFGGAITYWGAKKRRLISETPLEAIILETDAPWLCPVPSRGQRNDSTYLKIVVDTIATARHLEPETVIEVTTANARRTFPGLVVAGGVSGGGSF